MDLAIALAILVGGLLLLLIAGIPVAFALLVAGIAAFFAVEGLDALKFTGTIFWGRTATFQFLAAPLFVYMGFLLYESGMVSAMFRMINYWLGRMPGSLGIVALVSSGSFAAMSGSGSAAAATLGSVTAPEMRKYGFDKRFMLGILNGGASLAPLIPPSIALIIYSSLTETPVTRLFAAGVVPGLLLLSLMVGYVVLVALFRPNLAPRPEGVTWHQRIVSLHVVPVAGGVIFVVLGGIFLGWFVPVEAAALGVLTAIAVLVLYHRLRWREIVVAIWRGSREAATVGVFLMTLLVAGSVYSNVLNFFGLPQTIAEYLLNAGLGKWQFFLIMSVLLFLLGMFIDAVTIQVMTIPLVLPFVNVLGIDLVWFGIFLVLWIEVGTFTPPYGLYLFVLQGAMQASYGDAVKGAAPMIPIWILGVILLILFPALVTWLPDLLFN